MRNLYKNEELQLQTDFKSDRKFVRVCLEDKIAGPSQEFLRNRNRYRQAVGGV